MSRGFSPGRVAARLLCCLFVAARCGVFFVKFHWMLLLLFGAITPSALGQWPGSTVQLPTFSMFTTSTTVSVPDRGSVYLGGIKRAATGRNEFGTPILGKLPYLGLPFKSVGIGQERSASQMHVSAWIHDFDAMDEYLLAQPAAGRSLSSTWRRPRSAIAAMGHTLQPRNPGTGGSWLPANSNGSPTMTLAKAQAQRTARQQSRNDEAEDFFARGRVAEAEGKANVAKIYYQMAARRASTGLKEQVLLRLEAIGRAETGSAVVRTAP